MGWQHKLSFRFSSLLRNNRFEDEMDQELRSHFEQLVEDFRTEGHDEKTALRLARREFGSIDRAKEACRDNWGTRLLFDFFRDIRFATRLLLKSKGYAAVCILTIAIAIAACSTVFSLIDGVLLRPLPYENPERIVSVWELAEYGKNSVAGGSFLDWQENATSAEAMMIHNGVEQNLRVEGQAYFVKGWEVSSDFLDVLGVSTLLGRGFNENEDQMGAAPVVILTEEIWRKRFETDPNIIGKTVVLNETAREVVGILPAKTWLEPEIEYFIPAILDPTQSFRSGRAGHWALVWARLKAGATPEQLQNELRSIKKSLNPEYPEFKRNWSVSVEPLRELISQGARPILWTLSAAVGSVLLIACANVSNLVLARTINRRSELAMRTALGATGKRLVRQSLTESLLISLAGGFLGILLSIGSINLVRITSLTELPGSLLPYLNWQVLAAAVALTCGSTVLFGLLPSITAARRNPNAEIDPGDKSSAHGRQTRTQSLLVVLEIALTIALLSTAGLLLKSLNQQLSEDPGYNIERTITFDLNLPSETYRGRDKRLAYIRNLQQQLDTVPQIESASTLSSSPLNKGTFGEFVNRSDEEPPDPRPLASVIYVEDNFFETLQATLIAGRPFETFDIQAEAKEVVVIDQKLAGTLFGEERAVGKFVTSLGVDWEVVGVVENMKLDAEPRSAGYFFIPQQYFPFTLSAIVRYRGDSENALAAVQQVVRDLDSGISMANTRSLEAAIESTAADKRYVLVLLSVFAGIALLLATTGMYSVMAYAVATRRHEICIRKALGATRQSVIGLILKSGTKITLVGTICGILASLALSRLVSSQLYLVSPFDLGPLTIAAATIAAIGLAACWLPAMRSSKLSPNAGLRDN